MLTVGIVVMAIALDPAVDCRRSVLTRSAVIPEVNSPVDLCHFGDGARLSPRWPVPGITRTAIGKVVPVSVPDAMPRKVSPLVVASDAPYATSRPEIIFNPVTVSGVSRFLPQLVIPEPRFVSDRALESTITRMTYQALSDGSVDVRASKWRMPLVRMLVDGAPGTDFDHVYGLLRKSFGGTDEHARIHALAKWARENLSPRDAADVYRAETRYWLALGDSKMTVDAASRMERARSDYAVRARRLSALSYVATGDFEKAKEEISRSWTECHPESWEKAELLYIEAWIGLQDGDVGSARRKLELIVSECPDSVAAYKAMSVLKAIPEEVR